MHHDVIELRKFYYTRALGRVVQRVLRDRLSPDKVNLAALGNMVAHLHWHVIARWRWDSHFPGSVWAVVQRPRDPAREAEVQAQLDATDRAIAAALDART